MPITLIVLAQDAKVLELIQSRLSVTGATKNIVEVQDIVVPRSFPEVAVFAKQLEPMGPHLGAVTQRTSQKGSPMISAALLQIE